MALCSSRAFTTAAGVECPIAAACKTQQQDSAGVWATQPGVYLSSDCTDTSSAAAAIAAAAVTCGTADCVGSLAESCKDSDLRQYYHPSGDSLLEHNTLAAPSRWRLYEPRMRPWYTFSKAKHYTDGTLEAWTEPYAFASGQGMGLSAVGALTTKDVCGAGPLQADSAGCLAAGAHCSADSCTSTKADGTITP